MKKFRFLWALVLCLLPASVAFADGILVPTPWERLKRRPETSEVEVVIPDAVSKDVVSGDIADVVSGDAASTGTEGR
ncbi:MAG: hypothetical protein LBQ90_07745 [Synergistaceae bacterium]|nr:hypothetical protein [Synergistaceae bacterium]